MPAFIIPLLRLKKTILTLFLHLLDKFGDNLVTVGLWEQSVDV